MKNNDFAMPWEIEEETKIVDISDITIGDDTVKELILAQDEPLTIQEKLRALFSYEEKKDDPYPISARELHGFLGNKYRFADWFERMKLKCDLIENDDFNLQKNLQVQMEGNREVTRSVEDCKLTVSAAKEIAMIQNSDFGKLVRRYLIWAEKQYRNLVVSTQEEKSPAQFRTPIQYIAAMAVEMAKQEEKLLDHETKFETYDIKMNEHEERLKALEVSLAKKEISGRSVFDKKISMGDMAELLKDYGYDIGRNNLYSWLEEKGFVRRFKRGYKAAVQWERRGYLSTKEVTFADEYGNSYSSFSVGVTPEGQEWIIRIYSVR